MSAAVLMTDAWKPAVLHIVPFSNNGKQNAKVYDASDINNNRKSFPVLAVTRTNSADAVKKQKQNHSGSKTAREPKSNDKSSSGKLPATIAKKRAKSYPNSEASDHVITFQDLNDQASDPSLRTVSAASVDTQYSAISASVSEPPSNRYLPKPTFSDRGRYFGQTIVKRTTTLTPGEAELQKHRENYALEQAQKKNKYKLNVNELPRSTTPINDNDPDKLNMKQVIQFLQNSKSIRPNENMKSSSGKRYITTTAKFHKRSEGASTKQRPWSDITGLNSSNSTPYILDTKYNNYTNSESNCSSPDVSQKSAVSRKSSRSSATTERGHKEKRSKIELKSFKLYRFLAFADQANETPSNEDIQDNSKSNEEENNDKENEVKKKCPPEISKRGSFRSSRALHKKGNSGNINKLDAQTEGTNISEPEVQKSLDGTNPAAIPKDRLNVPTTANLMHRRVRERQRRNEGDTELRQNILPVSKKSSFGAIRLPSVQDFANSVHDLSDDRSETMADDQVNQSCDKFVIPIVCVTPPQEFENEPQLESVTSEKIFQHTQKMFNPKFAFPDHKPTESKKVLVSLPREMEKSPVKLMLRQEKNVTREQSYMYEIQSARSSEYPFPNNSSLNFPPDVKTERPTVPIATVSLRQKITESDEENLLDFV